MLRIAVVGCGKIADAHVSQVFRIPGCSIVAVCDREPLMARQICERFGIEGAFSHLETMLQQARPDVVHVTTSPESHFAIASVCLKAGSHVYVEKPFTLNAEEAAQLIALAGENGVKITAGHDSQFSHVARRMRALVSQGYLGGPPVHMESYYGYELGDNAYVRAFLNDKNHWVRKLPGMLAQNIISHGIASVAEFFTSDAPQVIVHGFTGPFLASRGETEIIDELRVMIAEQGGATAYFTFSSQMRPSLHSFRIYGEKNGLMVDFDEEVLIKLRGKRYKSYAEMFVPPVVLARQCFGNLRKNLGYFLHNDFQFKAGMKCLIESFYQSIETQSDPPIPYREILLTARIMDDIFRQIYPDHRDSRCAAPDAANSSPSD